MGDGAAECHHADTEVRLVRAPVPYANPLTDEGDIVATAGVLQRMMAGPETVRIVSNSVRLADTGIRSGDSITLWNSGGQWNNYYDRPDLRVQVVGPTEAEVTQRMGELLTKIDTELERIQVAKGVEPAMTVATQRLPNAIVAYELRGPTSQGAVVAVLLGLVSTLALIQWLDGRPAESRRVRRWGAVSSLHLST